MERGYKKSEMNIEERKDIERNKSARGTEMERTEKGDNREERRKTELGRTKEKKRGGWWRY